MGSSGASIDFTSDKGVVGLINLLSWKVTVEGYIIGLTGRWGVGVTGHLEYL